MSNSKIRILHLVPSLHRGGAERLVLTLAQQAKARGHQVKVVTLHEGNQFPELAENLDISTIKAQVSYSLTGTDHIDVEAFETEVRNFNPHIIHSHLFEAELVSMALPHPNTVHLTHWHGCHPPTDPKSITDFIRKDTWWNWNNVRKLNRNYRAFGSHFLCISSFIKDYVKRAFNPTETAMTVISNPIDLGAFSLNRQPQSGFQLVGVGSFTSLKNQQFLLRVMAKLKALGQTDVHLTLLGDGPDRPALENLTNSLEIRDYVTFAGIVNNPAHWLNRSHLLVHAAPLEPFGLVALEAKACGVPTLAFNQGGITEVVRHGIDGFLVDYDDVESFSDHILQLKNNPDQWHKFSAAGLDDVKRYNIDSYMDRLEALYHRLLLAKIKA